MVQRSAYVKGWKGRPTLWLDGTPEPNVSYRACTHGKEDTTSKESALQLVCVPCPFGDQTLGCGEFGVSGQTGVWSAPHQLDLTVLYDVLTRTVIAAPDSLILLRVELDVPSWWRQLHPTELRLMPDGRQLGQSLSSLLWLHEVGVELTRLIELVNEGPFGRHVIGYQLVAGRDTAVLEERFLDYSVPAREGFRRWLHRQYPSDEALQRAWDNFQVTRKTATLAPFDELAAVWRGSNQTQIGRQATDTCVYYTVSALDAVEWFSGLVKRVSETRALAGVFFDGVIAPCDLESRGWKRLLASDNIDFICTPEDASYVPTGGQAQVFLREVVYQHGKLWFGETCPCVTV